MTLEMDKNGFLRDNNKDLQCNKCGIQLDYSGNRPAETYAGTYTGLCYKCTNSEPYIIKDLGYNAKLWSFPPMCPSHSRDRRVFYSIDDCNNCDRGRIIIFRSDAKGGSYSKQCEYCFEEVCKISMGILPTWKDVTDDKLSELNTIPIPRNSSRYTLKNIKVGKQLTKTELQVYKEYKDETDISPVSGLLIFGDNLPYNKNKHKALIKLIQRGIFKVYKVPADNPSGFTYILKKVKKEIS